jgi:hypothetical protein
MALYLSYVLFHLISSEHSSGETNLVSIASGLHLFPSHVSGFQTVQQTHKLSYDIFAVWAMHLLMISKRPTNASLIQCVDY